MRKIKIIICAFLAVITVFGTSGCAKADDTMTTMNTTQVNVSDENGNELSDGNIHTLSKQMIFSGNAMSSTVEGEAIASVLVSVTIEPIQVVNKLVDWNVSFVNPSSDWAVEKNVTDYIEVKPLYDGALQANVICKEAFGEQIKLTVVSRVNQYKTAECLIDFERRCEELSGAIDGNSVDFLNDTSMRLQTTGDEWIPIEVTSWSFSDTYTLKTGALIGLRINQAFIRHLNNTFGTKYEQGAVNIGYGSFNIFEDVFGLSAEQTEEREAIKSYFKSYQGETIGPALSIIVKFDYWGENDIILGHKGTREIALWIDFTE